MKSAVRGAIITLLVFAAILSVLIVGLNQVDSRDRAKQAEALKQAVRRATTLCYAVEGRYPSGARELRERYGLCYDEDKYIVVLDAFASNQYPDVRVLAVGGDAFE